MCQVPKLSERELAVLKVLNSRYGTDTDCLCFRFIANETGLDRRLVRRACRSLARKGLANYERGLFNEDGEVAGSGYRCTFEGCYALDHMEEK